MRIARDDVPVRINAPGAIARQVEDFGDATGYGKIGGEYFSLAEGTDLARYCRACRETFASLRIGVIFWRVISK